MWCCSFLQTLQSNWECLRDFSLLRPGSHPGYQTVVFFYSCPYWSTFLFLPVSFKYCSWLFPYLGLSFADGVFTLKWVQKLYCYIFSKFFMLLSQLVQDKIFKLECHPHKNAECFAGFCEFRSLGSHDACWIVYWMCFFFISSLNFVYQNEWSLDSRLSARCGMTTSEYPELNFACMHVCMKAESTSIFFPRIRETKVRAPHTLIYARLMHRIQQSSLNEGETCRWVKKYHFQFWFPSWKNIK